MFWNLINGALLYLGLVEPGFDYIQGLAFYLLALDRLQPTYGYPLFVDPALYNSVSFNTIIS